MKKNCAASSGFEPGFPNSGTSRWTLCPMSSEAVSGLMQPPALLEREENMIRTDPQQERAFSTHKVVMDDREKANLLTDTLEKSKRTLYIERYSNGAYAEWDVCKSPGFPTNRVAPGQVDPPAVRITMVCSLFACCLSASEAFLFLSGAVCWVFSKAYTKEEHLLVFSWLVIGEGPEVTRRRRPLVDCATPPRHLSKKQKSTSLGLNNVPA